MAADTVLADDVPSIIGKVECVWIVADGLSKDIAHSGVGFIENGMDCVSVWEMTLDTGELFVARCPP